MKKYWTICLAFIFIFSPVMMGAQEKESTADFVDETADEVAAALAAQRYLIEVDWAIPMGGANVSLSHGYHLEVRNDTIVAHLPFYGRAYSLPYGEGGGIEFEEVTEDYHSEDLTGKRNPRTEITFSVRTRQDNHEFRVTVFSGGQASISVNSNHRGNMGYRGTLFPLKEK